MISFLQFVQPSVIGMFISYLAIVVFFFKKKIKKNCSIYDGISCIDFLFFTYMNLRNIYLGCVSANSMPEVRESAGLAFSTLYKVILLIFLLF